MDTGNPQSFRPAVVQLETRDVPAIASISLSNLILTVRTDNTDSVVLVANGAGNVSVLDGTTGVNQTFSVSQVGRVDVFGGNGNDQFTSRGNTPGLLVRLLGKGGNDFLEGDANRNVLVGGDGNDTIFGRGGNDQISGLLGNDFIFGGIGGDAINGNEGDDTIIGGQGIDALSGGIGDDVIVALDEANQDIVDAGTGNDVAWLDQTAGVQESATGLEPTDIIHAVGAFANGPDRTLNGDRIPDPALGIQDRPNDKYESFFGRPLFPNAGPSISDIQQNASPGTVENARLNDGWFLSALGGTILEFPDFLRQNVVDFADGTYGIDLAGTFFRVDNDLPVEQFGDVLPAFAKVGPDNSLWVPILEKLAASIVDPNNFSYSAINGGTPDVAFELLGATVDTLQLPGIFIDADQMGIFIKQELALGHPIVVTVASTPAGVPLVVGQSYTITGVTLDVVGLVSRVQLRNPTGVDGPVQTDPNPNDGFVDISINDLFATTGRMDIATFPPGT